MGIEKGGGKASSYSNSRRRRKGILTTKSPTIRKHVVVSKEKSSKRKKKDVGKGIEKCNKKRKKRKNLCKDRMIQVGDTLNLSDLLFTNYRDYLIIHDQNNRRRRKTLGVALSIILTIRSPQVLDKLDQISSACTSVILGGSEYLSEEESSSDNMSPTRPQFPSKEYRKRQIKLSDPVHHSSLENSVRENLQTCAAIHGESFNSAIGKMHPAAFAQLKQALNIT